MRRSLLGGLLSLHLQLTPNPAPAAPTVTMAVSHVGGYWSLDYKVLDFYYTASPGAEFSLYSLSVQTSGPHILDPVRAALYDAGGDAIDTWANTVGSQLGFGSPGYSFDQYKPIGLKPSLLPTAWLDWAVFDTEKGDGNNIPGYGQAPWHIARVLLDPETRYSATVGAFDSQSGRFPTQFNFQEHFQNVVASHSTVVSTPGETISHLFKAAEASGPVWSDFAFTGLDAATVPSFDYSTQQFMWNTSGSQLGTYTASVKVSEPGFDIATLTIILVPEPAACGMIVLTFVGWLSAARSRRDEWQSKA